MTAPPKPKALPPIRTVGIVKLASGGFLPSIVVDIAGQTVSCEVKSGAMPSEFEPGCTAVLINRAPKHPQPFADRALNRVFTLVQQGRAPVVYIIRKAYQGIQPVSPRTYPYN
jgi:hypothetical protein